ncbi:MAG: metallophosphoesterase family protein [bacterium]|nr:metallophosphoesterase family protein [bacterium]
MVYAKSLRYRYGKVLFVFFVLSLSSYLLYAAQPQLDNSPERIILNLTATPANSVAVTWRTNAAVINPQAQITLANESTDLTKSAKTVPAKTESVQLDNGTTVYQYSVIFDALKPNTLYAYRVGNEKYWSEWNQFRTATDTIAAFKFIYFGDPQNDIKSMCSRIFRAAYTKAPDARFWLITGDIVNNGNKDELWAELYDAFGWIPRMTPIILLPGNHEYLPKPGATETTPALTYLWRPQFTLPENGPAGLEESVYYLDYQGVRLVMLNGNEKLEEQAQWLDSVLAKNQQRWTIVAIHQPFYSTAVNRDNPQLQKLFLPIFDKYTVDLVLQGHDHTYGRTYKLRNGKKVADTEPGTVYVVSVSGTKVYGLGQKYKDVMVKMENGRQLFQVISVDKNSLSYESYNALGELYDSFKLKKK